jgi:hypothetical protein
VADAGERGVEVLVSFGRDDPNHVEFEVARPLGLEPLLAAPTIEVEVLDGPLHSFVDVDLQPRVIDTVVRWLRRVADRQAAFAPVTESWISS